MRDIKKTKTIISTAVDKKTAPQQAGFAVQLPRLTGLSIEKEVYAAAAFFGVLLATYAASMVGITIFAIQEKNYTFKTEELRSEQSISNTASAQDALALSGLDVHKDRMTHLYINDTQMTSVSQR